MECIQKKPLYEDSTFSKLKSKARMKVKSLGHDPTVFSLKRGVFKSYCRKCVASMEIATDKSTITGSMLTRECTGQVFLYRVNKS